jgi:hypothetical protein
MPSPEYDKKYWEDVVFDWADSKFLVEDQGGNLVEAGTILRLRNKIEFLHHLTEDQLNSLKSTVAAAVDHELSKRQS